MPRGLVFDVLTHSMPDSATAITISSDRLRNIRQIIKYASWSPIDGTENHFALGGGFLNASENISSATLSLNGEANTTDFGVMSSDAFQMIGPETQGIIVRSYINGIDGNSVEIEYESVFETHQPVATTILIGGDEAELAQGTIFTIADDQGEADVELGFDPDVIIIFSSRADEGSLDSIFGQSLFSFGAAVRTGAGDTDVDQMSSNMFELNNSAAGNPAYLFSNQYIFANLISTATNFGAILSWISNGFRLTTNVESGSPNGAGMNYLAIKLPEGMRATLLERTTPTSVTTQNVSLGWRPQFLMAGGGYATAANTFYNNANAGVFGIGCMTDKSTMSAVSAQIEDASATTDTQSIFSNKLIHMPPHTGGVGGIIATAQVNDTSVDLDFTGVDGSARKYFLLAIEESIKDIPRAVLL